MSVEQAWLLSLFQTSAGLKAAQLFQILKGKRTGSTLYQALVEKLLIYYGLFPHMNRTNYDQWINQLVQSNILVDQKETGRLVIHPALKEDSPPHFFSQAQKQGQRYTCIDQWHYGFCDYEFWMNLQFASQVVSEYSYACSDYQALSSSPSRQFWMKQWFKKYKSDQLAADLSAEWLQLLSALTDDQANFIARQLTGHKRIGQTAQQASPRSYSSYLFQKSCLHAVMATICFNKKEYPLMQSLFQAAQSASYHGLSLTAYKSYHSLKQGLSVEEIAQKRGVKIGTIADHLVEIAIFCGYEHIQSLYTAEDRAVVKQFLDNNPPAYKLFKEQYPDFPFYKYRLIEMEGYLIDGR